MLFARKCRLGGWEVSGKVIAERCFGAGSVLAGLPWRHQADKCH